MFKPYEAIPAKKVAIRPSRFKLAYIGNSVDHDRKGFGMESDTKTKDRYRNTHYAVWNTYMLRPHPGHTGNYTPVPGRRVGKTQMEESRRLVERYPGTYADVYKSTRE